LVGRIERSPFLLGGFAWFQPGSRVVREFRLRIDGGVVPLLAPRLLAVLDEGIARDQYSRDLATICIFHISPGRRVRTVIERVGMEVGHKDAVRLIGVRVIKINCKVWTFSRSLVLTGPVSLASTDDMKFLQVVYVSVNPSSLLTAIFLVREGVVPRLLEVLKDCIMFDDVFDGGE
jgi:hypothetical protein